MCLEGRRLVGSSGVDERGELCEGGNGGGGEASLAVGGERGEQHRSAVRLSRGPFAQRSRGGHGPLVLLQSCTEDSALRLDQTRGPVQSIRADGLCKHKQNN